MLENKDIPIRVNDKLGNEFNDVMGFLNDISFKYPNAISFVSGKPDEFFFNVKDSIKKISLFADYYAEKKKKTYDDVFLELGQYNKTKGIINGIIKKYLKNDHAINVKEDDILITVGAQEAFGVVVVTLCNKNSDIILTENPSYIGFSSFAHLFGYDICGIPMNKFGMNLFALEEQILKFQAGSKRVKMVYVNPDHQNPTGTIMPIENRRKLLDLAKKYNFLIIEDGAYNSLNYSMEKILPIKALDRFGRVIYIGSFSKIIFPSLRIGFIACNYFSKNDKGRVTPLIDEMTKVKAQITTNTSTINQAIIGGVLLDQQFSLIELNRIKKERYKEKLERLLMVLNKNLGDFHDISWNIPRGGFFIVLNLPFKVNSSDIAICAKDFKIIFCPMSFFYLGNKGGEKQIRLAFSFLTLDQIDEGVYNLSLYIKERYSQFNNTYI